MAHNFVPRLILLVVALAVVIGCDDYPNLEIFNPEYVHTQFYAIGVVELSHAERLNDRSEWGKKVVDDTIRRPILNTSNKEWVQYNQRLMDQRPMVTGRDAAFDCTSILNKELNVIDTTWISGDIFRSGNHNTNIDFDVKAQSIPRVTHTDVVLPGYAPDKLTVFEIGGAGFVSHFIRITWDSTYFSVDPQTHAERRDDATLIRVEEDEGNILRVMYSDN